MQAEKTLRVIRDRSGWTVEGDRHPRSFFDRTQAIARAEIVAQDYKACEVVIADEQGNEESRRVYADGRLAS